MKLIKIHILKSFVAMSALSFATSMPWAQEKPERAPLPVVNYSGVSGIGEYVAARASDEQYALFLQNQNLAIYAWTTSFGQDKPWCVAQVGLTHRPGNAQNMPRMPVTRYLGGASDPSFGPVKCKAEAVKRALDRMLATQALELQDSIEQTLPSGGKRVSEKPDTTSIHSSYSGMNPQGNKYINTLIPEWFPRFFDYRAVTVVKRYFTIDGDDGQLICFTSIGLTARPPADRQPNEPVAESARSKLLNEHQRGQAQNDSTCFDPLFEALVQDQFKPEGGLIETFLRTWTKVAEPGLQAPTQKDVNAAAAWQVERDRQAALKRQREQARSARVAQANSCSVNCVNGNCIRRWPNGRSERFQAPRKYNPFTSQWEWDTSGC